MSTPYTPPSDDTLRWVEESVGLGARVHSVAPLRGGITAAMDRLLVVRGEQHEDLVLRRWSTDDPDTLGLVDREAAALDAVRGSGVPAPTLVAGDEDGATAGARCTLTTALAGTPDLSPADPSAWLSRLVAAHVGIHAVAADVRWSWDGWYDAEAPLDWITDPGLREAARAAAGSGVLDRQVVFAHGDYQHFNILWQDGLLTGVVDWPNAGMAPLGIDVGHCRLNLALLFSAAFADEYLRRYERAAGLTVDPQADLRALLCFDLSWPGFIPRQVDGRAALDVAGMPARVVDVVRSAVDRMG